MTDPTHARVVRATTAAALAAFVATAVLRFTPVSGALAPGVAANAAGAVLVLTVLVLVACVVQPSLPNGRKLVPVNRYAPDGVFLAITLAGLPCVLWERLAAIAGPAAEPYSFGGSPLPVPALTWLLLMAVRRAYAWSVARADAPVAAPRAT